MKRLALALFVAVVAAGGLVLVRRWYKSPERWEAPPPIIETLGPGARRVPRPTFAETAFPRGEAWVAVDPIEAGWDAALLADAVARAQELHTSAFLLVYQGRIVAEHYGPIDETALRDDVRRTLERNDRGRTADGQPILNVTSVQKSVVGALVAMARDRGLLDYDTPLAELLAPDFRPRPPERDPPITVRHVLTMTSGLTSALAFEEPAGTAWTYNPHAPILLLGALAHVAELTPEALLDEWLVQPLGLEHTAWVFEDSTPAGLVATARDLARIGLWIQTGGRWSDERLIRATHIWEVGRQSQRFNAAYGLLWWLNQPGAIRSGGAMDHQRPLPDAPHDMALAIGDNSTHLCVSPRERLVFVRFGAGIPMKPEMNSIWRRIMAARPAEPESR